MKKEKKCLFPKCEKEVPGKKGVLCGEHSKKGKDFGKASAGIVGTIILVGITKIAKDKLDT